MNGAMTVKGRTTDVNVDWGNISSLVQQSQIPKDLFELAGYAEARNGRFSVFADVLYMKVRLDGSMTRARGVDELNGALGTSACLKYEMVSTRRALVSRITNTT